MQLSLLDGYVKSVGKLYLRCTGKLLTLPTKNRSFSGRKALIKPFGI
jgi:hypothetical protein